MKVWVFVEGPSDRLALMALWDGWLRSLGSKGWGIHVLPLDSKSQYLRKIGPRVAEKLAQAPRDLVVGLPDLYPIAPYRGTPHEHADLPALQTLQKSLVEEALRTVFKVTKTDSAMGRFHASAMKHDLEVLLLAAKASLRTRLKTKEALGNWRNPPEDQNHDKPPKRIVEELFRTKLGRAYLDTTDFAAAMRNTALRDVLLDDRGNVQCPVFKAVVDWIAAKTGVPAY